MFTTMPTATGAAAGGIFISTRFTSRFVRERAKEPRDPGHEPGIEAPRPREPAAFRHVDARIELDHGLRPRQRVQDASRVVEGVRIGRHELAVA